MEVTVTGTNIVLNLPRPQRQLTTSPGSPPTLVVKSKFRLEAVCSSPTSTYQYHPSSFETLRVSAQYWSSSILQYFASTTETHYRLPTVMAPATDPTPNLDSAQFAKDATYLFEVFRESPQPITVSKRSNHTSPRLCVN